MLSGARLGRYVLRSQIGIGGMAEVYLADEGEDGFDRPVAIKLVRQALIKDPQIVEMFLAETKLSQRLRHGNIVQVIGSGRHQGLPYLVMEYVDGLPLDQLIVRLRNIGEQLEADVALGIVEDVCAALHYAHRLTDKNDRSLGVVHRDVNTKNVLISEEGVVKLTDFGIAKVRDAPNFTQPGQMRGTLGSLSPEHARGQPIDARSDVFSTGVMLYELLSGNNPLVACTPLEYLDRLEKGMPPLPLTPPIDEELQKTVAKALSVESKNRQRSMNDLASELEAWRVRNGIRRDPDKLRSVVRRALGKEKSKEANFGAALRGQLPTQAGTAKNTQAPAEEHSNRKELWLGIACFVLAALGVLALLVWKGQAAEPGANTAAVTAADDAGAARFDAGAAIADARAAIPDAAADTAVPIDASIATPKGASAPPPKIDAGKKTRPAISEKLPPPKNKAAGTLLINVLPYAYVRVDGNKRGRTPTKLKLAAGSHEIVLENPDTGQRTTKRINLAPGKTTRITRW